MLVPSSPEGENGMVLLPAVRKNYNTTLSFPPDATAVLAGSNVAMQHDLPQMFNKSSQSPTWRLPIGG